MSLAQEIVRFLGEPVAPSGQDAIALAEKRRAARIGSAKLLKRQLETGQYFPAARERWRARHGSSFG